MGAKPITSGRYPRKKIAYAIDREHNEVNRAVRRHEHAPCTREFLTRRYSIADMACVVGAPRRAHGAGLAQSRV